MKNRFSKILAGLVLITGALTLPVYSQIPNTMFFMPGVPQSNRINPAIQPGCGFYLGAPALAPLRLQIGSNSFAVSDIIYPGPEGDSLITPFHPLGDKDAFLNNLGEKNFIKTDVALSLMSFGFRAGKSFISADMNLRVDSKVGYPGGVFNFLFNGASDSSYLDLGGLGLDLSAYIEMGLGWSRRDFILPNLDIGFRGKLLFGLANIYTRSSVLDIRASMEEWNIHSDYELGIAVNPILFDMDAYEVNFSDFEPPVFVKPDLSNIGTLVTQLLTNDFGMAADLGVNYRPIPQLQVSASLLDLGFINWNNSKTASFNFDYDWRGLEVNPITGIDTTMLTQILDSVQNSLFITNGGTYISRLNSKLFVGASFYPVKKIGLGILSRTDFLHDQVSQQFTGSVNMTTGKFINLALSYSYMYKSFNNIGAGFSFNVGPFNLYLISDNIVSAAWNPFDTRSVNLWFGMNLAFGWKQRESQKKAAPVDRPLIM